MAISFKIRDATISDVPALFPSRVSLCLALAERTREIDEYFALCPMA